jgi:hypothetical protein
VFDGNWNDVVDNTAAVVRMLQKFRTYGDLLQDVLRHEQLDEQFDAVG